MARKKVVPEYGTIMKRGVQYYRTRMQDADGKWISLYAQTPEELYDKSIEMKRSIEDEIFRKNNPTVAEYCEKWLKMRSASVRENTLSGYERTIRKYIIGAIGDMYMDEVTTDDLRLLLVPISNRDGGLKRCQRNPALKLHLPRCRPKQSVNLAAVNLWRRHWGRLMRAFRKCCCGRLTKAA